MFYPRPFSVTKPDWRNVLLVAAIAVLGSIRFGTVDGLLLTAVALLLAPQRTL